MNWDDLRYFLAAYRCKTLVGAGRVLGVNGSTVGRRLAALEESLSTPLFHRTSDGLVPLAAADLLLESAEFIEGKARMVPALITTDVDLPEGIVRIASSPEIAQEFLMPRLEAFHGEFPKITLEFHLSHDFVDLSRGDVDVAVRWSQARGRAPVSNHDEDLVTARWLGHYAVRLYASKAYLSRRPPPQIDDGLEGHAIILSSSNTSYMPGTPWLFEHASNARVALKIDGLSGILHACAAGFGVAALPCICAQTREELVPLDAPEVIESHEGWLLIPTAVRHLTRVQAVVGFLERTLRSAAMS